MVFKKYNNNCWWFLKNIKYGKIKNFKIKKLKLLKVKFFIKPVRSCLFFISIYTFFNNHTFDFLNKCSNFFILNKIFPCSILKKYYKNIF